MRVSLPERARQVLVRLAGKRVLTWTAGREGTVIFQKTKDATHAISHESARGIDWIEFHGPTIQSLPAGGTAPSKRSPYQVVEVCSLDDGQRQLTPRSAAEAGAGLGGAAADNAAPD